MAREPVIRAENQILGAIADLSERVDELPARIAAAPGVAPVDLSNVEAGLGAAIGELIKVGASIAALEAKAVSALAKLDQIIAAGGQPGGEQPPPPATDWPLPSQPAAGSTVILSAGLKAGAMHLDGPVVVQGAGMRSTILDGRGGVGAGHRLAWGKGIIHATGNIRVQDIGFTRGGGGDGKSDGEAGFYTEGGPLSAFLVRCAFDSGENGVYVPGGPSGNTIDLTVGGCVFGRVSANGLSDGRAHDMYVGAKTVTIMDSVFAGNSRGHAIKVRGPHLSVSNSYIARSIGRWIDCPGGTVGQSTGNTYVTLPGAPSGNAMAFYAEADTNAAPTYGSFLSTDDVFYFSRHTEVIWINHAEAPVEFVRPRVFWIGAAGATPPNVVIQGPGKLWGNNPFVFSEANRVDAPPPIPADPTA